MQRWCAYTGYNLILGCERLVCSVFGESLTRHIKKQAEGYVASNNETVVAAIMSPLAMKEIRGSLEPSTAFQSASQVMELFEKGDPAQIAANILNGQMTSSLYPHDIPFILSEITKAFNNGTLYSLPRDILHLHEPKIIATLPEALAYFLKSQSAEKQAFVNYLRRGIPPVIAPEVVQDIMIGRTVAATWGGNEYGSLY